MGRYITKINVMFPADIYADGIAFLKEELKSAKDMINSKDIYSEPYKVQYIESAQLLENIIRCMYGIEEDEEE